MTWTADGGFSEDNEATTPTAFIRARREKPRAICWSTVKESSVPKQLFQGIICSETVIPGNYLWQDSYSQTVRGFTIDYPYGLHHVPSNTERCIYGNKVQNEGTVEEPAGTKRPWSRGVRSSGKSFATDDSLEFLFRNR